MIFNFFHLIFGYIYIRAYGGFAERFINLCTRNSIPLWNIKKQGDSIFARTSINGFINIRTPAKDSGMKIAVIKKHGLPFVIRKYRKRLGIAIGFTIFVIGLIMLSGRVWLIDVIGNESVDSVQIETIFENEGLKFGSKISKLDTVKIRINALKKLPNISWATVNFRGCKAVIEIREGESKPNVEIKDETSNIVATKDGQVEIIEPFSGVASVKPGQTVLKGNLLISGIRQNRIDANLYTDAQGYIVARTEINVDYTCNSEKYYTIKQRRFYSIYLLGVNYPFIPNYKCNTRFTENLKAEINSVTLPLGITKVTYTSKGKEKTVSDEFRWLTALEEYAIKSYYETSHTQIISENISFSKSKNSIKISGKYSCFENIGTRSNYYVEETDLSEQ